jgi:VCBS repeat-containing protein
VSLPGLSLATLRGFLKLASTDTAQTAGGKVNWTFNSGKHAFNALPEGEILTLTYTVRVTDAANARDTHQVVITITGTNDAATITGTASGAVVEDAVDGTASGKLTVADPDQGQAAFAAPAEAALNGTYGSFTFNAATGAWSYALDNTRAETQALAAGQEAQDALEVVSTDGSAKRTISVKVTGTNDAPVIVPPESVVIDFDNIVLEEGGETPIPTHAGFTWAQTGVYDPSAADSLGYVASSGDNLAFFAEARPDPDLDIPGYPLPANSPLVIRRADGADFTFLQATFSSGIPDELVVTATAFDDGVEVGTHSFTVRRDVAEIVNLSAILGERFSSIDELRFHADNYFGFDDFTFTGVEPILSERADGAADENSGKLNIAGGFAFTDVDLADVHSPTVVEVGGDVLGSLSASVVKGSVSWSYTVDAALLDSLGAGQTRVESFDVTVNDGQGGTATQRIDVTLLGVWSGPHQTGQAAWLADCRAMNSRGERMRKPECGWMVL